MVRRGVSGSERSLRVSVTGFEKPVDALHSPSSSPPETADPVRGRFFSDGGMIYTYAVIVSDGVTDG